MEITGETKNAVELKKVSVYYEQVCALRDIDMTVRQGDFLAVIGPNGSGKSTLLKVILGLISPSRGEVSLYGSPVRKSHGLIGYVPQFTQVDRLFPISVVEVVLMGRLSGKREFQQIQRAGPGLCQKCHETAGH